MQSGKEMAFSWKFKKTVLVLYWAANQSEKWTTWLKQSAFSAKLINVFLTAVKSNSGMCKTVKNYYSSVWQFVYRWFSKNIKEWKVVWALFQWNSVFHNAMRWNNFMKTHIAQWLYPLVSPVPIHYNTMLVECGLQSCQLCNVNSSLGSTMVSSVDLLST